MHVWGGEVAVEEEHFAGHGIYLGMACRPLSHPTVHSRAAKSGLLLYFLVHGLSFCGVTVKPADSLQAWKLDAHRWSTFACRQRTAIVIKDARVGYANPLDDLL